MLKRTFEYEDYNGVNRTEDAYFNLSEAEVLELEAGTSGGFVEMLDRIVASKDGPSIMREFKKIILKAYGKKSDDGKQFIKSEELSLAFSQTPMYTQLFMELALNADAASAFVHGILPKNMGEIMAKYAGGNQQKPAEIEKGA